ncbi:CLK4-associating serine/arginine rich protein-like isoform X1 [Styela clava]
MWHEARRQEKKIRKFIVDHKKRSERRHEYYERIKQDPTKFLQVHGRKAKIHLDGTVAVEADNNHHMMPWQGDSSNMIDRFDVRTHLDYYIPTKKESDELVTEEEIKCNFERYRVLIWNEYKRVSEHQHLRQIYIEEQFPEIAAEQKQSAEAQKQILAQGRATIGYNYEVDKNNSSDSISKRKAGDDDEEEEDDDKDDFDITAELEEIPPLSEISMEAITALDDIGVKSYSLRRGGFGDCLLDDQDYIDKIGAAKALESEKQKFSGRKSRRERKLLKDERLKGRKISALSYVQQESSSTSSESSEDASSSESTNSNSSDEDEKSKRKSKGNIEYITSFGGEQGKNCPKSNNSITKEPKKSKADTRSRKYRRRSHSHSPERNRSRSRSRSPRYRKSSSRSRRSRSRSYERRRSRSRSRDRTSRSRQQKRSNYSSVANISSTSQSSENILKSLSKTKTAEEKAAALQKLTPQQKLKIRMQRALNKQLKVDRNADNEKRIIKQQEVMERDDDIREMSRKMRQRAGERREYTDSPYH